MDADRLRVCLERTIDLWPVQIRLREWPGFGGPVVQVPDPVCESDDVLQALVRELAPRCRVLSVEPRRGQPYQVGAADLLGVLEQFGFSEPVLVGEGLGSVPALLVAAWHPERLGKLVLIDPVHTAPRTAAESGMEGSLASDCRVPRRSQLEEVRLFGRTSRSAALEAHALRDCPPDWPSLLAAVQCPMLTVEWKDSALATIVDFIG